MVHVSWVIPSYTGLLGGGASVRGPLDPAHSRALGPTIKDAGGGERCPAVYCGHLHVQALPPPVSCSQCSGPLPSPVSALACRVPGQATACHHAAQSPAPAPPPAESSRPSSEQQWGDMGRPRLWSAQGLFDHRQVMRNSGYACVSWKMTKMEGLLRLSTVLSYRRRAASPSRRGGARMLGLPAA